MFKAENLLIIINKFEKNKIDIANKWIEIE